MRRFLRFLALGFGALLVVVLLLLSPAAYVETFCHGEPVAQNYTPLITDPAQRRAEANTYLTYPEWHIVYAYDGMAEVLKNGDEHQFGYFESVKGFWQTNCAVIRIADAHGGADTDTRMTIATIGVSFTLEMGLKAAYEETFGRLTAWWRGPAKTPQDIVARDMAVDYAAFLRQVPWYKYPFQKALDKLDAAPRDGGLRSWERRFALGAEWKAKIAYSKAIASAVNATTGQAQLSIVSLVSGIDVSRLGAIADVRIIAEKNGRVLIETPRYDRFTHILAEIASAGGTIEEIAGNDDIMITLTVTGQSVPVPLNGDQIIARLPRTGFAGERVLLSVKVRDLADILRSVPIADPGIEHVFDY